MSYTFGAGTGDDVNTNIINTYGGDNSNQFFAGWFYPTTLTTGRCLFSLGNVYSVLIATGAVECQLVTDNTNDGSWLTSGLALVTNEWQFLAFLNACENTGPAGAWRCWKGTANQPPQEVTVNADFSPTGNFVGSSALYVGNRGTGTVAFQGDIGWLTMLGIESASINNYSTIATSGSISNTEAANTYNRWVYPLWAGRPDRAFMTGASLGTQFLMVHVELRYPNPLYYRWFTSASTADVILNINGATHSENQPPRSLAFNHPHSPIFVPGRRR